ncbi:MAG: NAD(P)-binding domain-containing protein [Vulcanimicrobiaceae bacterium]
MKIGILGGGDVGRALARGFTSEGHEVVVGTRTPRDGMQSFAEAAQFGEVLVLATLWAGTQPAIESAGPRNFENKIVIDVTNPLVMAPDAPPSLALGHTDSGGEQVQRWLASSKVVKAFNSVGHAFMYKPDFPGGPPTLFIAGHDDGAKATLKEIVRSFGWETLDAGGIDGARALEALCLLWVTTSIRSGNFNQAFKMLRK